MLIHGYYRKGEDPGPWFEFDEYTNLLKLVFAQNPTKNNLIKVFNHPVIRVLWTYFFLKSEDFETF